MISLTLLIAPIFLIIVTGYLLHQSLIKDDNVWNYLNKLAYWVLFPCLLFNKTSVINFEDFAIGPLAVTVIVGFSAAAIISFLLSKLGGIRSASTTSIVQGGARHNAFLALAIVTQIFGGEGATIGAIIIAVLVTFTNISVNIMMTVMLSPKGSSALSILKDLQRNPFIIAISIGAIFNVMGFGNLPILHDFTANVGETTLTIALLCVGAGLKIKGVGNNMIPCLVACFSKMIVFPVVVYLCAAYFGLPHVVMMTAMIFAMSPAGAASYPLAKQMGGDAPLMATLISLQTLMSVISIPLIIYLLSPGGSFG